MSDTCQQEPMIRVMDARQASMDKKLDRMVEAMEALAAQRVEIDNLSKQHVDTRKWIKDHEHRIQELEKAPGSAASKFMWMIVGAIVTILPTVVSGVLLYRMKGTP